MNYINHVVDCQCILQIYSKVEKPIYHKFVVFSTITEDNFDIKYVECNNCGLIHEVYDVGKSNLKSDGDKYKALVTTKEDLQYNLPEKYVNFLVKNKVEETYIWENINYLLENNIAGNIIYNKETIDNKVICSFISINEDNTFKIYKETFQRDLQ